MDKFIATVGIFLACVGGMLTGYKDEWEPLGWISPAIVFFSVVLVLTSIDVARARKK